MTLLSPPSVTVTATSRRKKYDSLFVLASASPSGVLFSSTSSFSPALYLLGLLLANVFISFARWEQFVYYVVVIVFLRRFFCTYTRNLTHTHTPPFPLLFRHSWWLACAHLSCPCKYEYIVVTERARKIRKKLLATLKTESGTGWGGRTCSALRPESPFLCFVWIEYCYFYLIIFYTSIYVASRKAWSFKHVSRGWFRLI